MSKKFLCKNCDLEFNDSYNYCPNCGQKSNDELTMGVLFSNTISNYFSVDARFFRSFIPLMFKPGDLARKFVDGKRLRYLHPAQFYLFISVVFFFLFSIVTRQHQQDLDAIIKQEINIDFSDSTNTIAIPANEAKEVQAMFDSIKKDSAFTSLSEIQKDRLMVVDSFLTDSTVNIKYNDFSINKNKLDSLIKIDASLNEKLTVLGVSEDTNSFKRLVTKQGLKIYEQQGGGILKSFYDTIPISMFFLLPLFALLLKIMYYKKGHFSHHMVFSFYYFTFMFVVVTFLSLINLFFEIPDWIDTLIVFSTFFYLVLSLRRFYEQSFFASIFKAVILSFIYMTIVIPIAAFFMLFISFLLY
ncbi:MAG: DUF3667 domain-containing protein [Cellulophaga sp.]